MALSGMEIGLLVGLLVFVALLAIGTWLLGDGRDGSGAALIILGVLGIVAFFLALLFVNTD